MAALSTWEEGHREPFGFAALYNTYHHGTYKNLAAKSNNNAQTDSKPFD